MNTRLFKYILTVVNERVIYLLNYYEIAITFYLCNQGYQSTLYTGLILFVTLTTSSLLDLRVF